MSTSAMNSANLVADAPKPTRWAATGKRALQPGDATEAALLSDRAKAAKPFTGDWRLGKTLRVWLAHRSPRLIGIGFLTLVATRCCMGPLSWADLAAVVALFLWEPVNEWIIHAHLLHLIPKQIGPAKLGLRWDLPMARRHRRHHADPWDLPNLFIPIGAILFSLVFHGLLFWAFLPAPVAVTALATVNGIGLIYEWTHYVAHVPYRPLTPWMRTLQQRHRLHHFKNERFWLGVSSNLGDRLLRTLPDAKEVEPSPTARLLQRA